MGQLVAQNVHHRIVQKLTGREPAMKDLEEFSPMIAIALAKKAVAYAPHTGVAWGDDVLQTYFGDDMAFSCEFLLPIVHLQTVGNLIERTVCERTMQLDGSHTIEELDQGISS
jgi:hypothetical protein